MKKQLLFSLLLSFFLFSCGKKKETNVEKKWVATVSSDYKLLTTSEDSLFYRWEGGTLKESFMVRESSMLIMKIVW